MPCINLIKLASLAMAAACLTAILKSQATSLSLSQESDIEKTRSAISNFTKGWAVLVVSLPDEVHCSLRQRILSCPSSLVLSKWLKKYTYNKHSQWMNRRKKGNIRPCPIWWLRLDHRILKVLDVLSNSHSRNNLKTLGNLSTMPLDREKLDVYRIWGIAWCWMSLATVIAITILLKHLETYPQCP